MQLGRGDKLLTRTEASRTMQSLQTPRRLSVSQSLGALVHSQRALRQQQSALQGEMLRSIRSSLQSPLISSAVKTINSLRPPPRLSAAKEYRFHSQSSHSTLERIEALWPAAESRSIEELVAQASVLTSRLPRHGAVPRPLIAYLSRSPLGVEVLKCALKTLPEDRLHSDSNYAAIVQTLKERSLKQSRQYKLLRRKRAAQLSR